jgi:hypothetical protein
VTPPSIPNWRVLRRIALLCIYVALFFGSIGAASVLVYTLLTKLY